MNWLTGGGGLLNPYVDSFWWFVLLCGVVFMVFRAIYRRNKK